MPKLKIEYVPIEELRMNPQNPRIHPTSQVLALKGSLENYYPHPFIDEAYKGWRRLSKSLTAWSCGVTRDNPIIRKPQRTELLLMNY